MKTKNVSSATEGGDFVHQNSYQRRTSLTVRKLKRTFGSDMKGTNYSLGTDFADGMVCRGLAYSFPSTI